MIISCLDRDIATDGGSPERSGWNQPFLLQRGHDALFPLNREILGSAIEEVICRLTVSATSSMIEKNHIFLKFLTDDISLQYKN